MNGDETDRELEARVLEAMRNCTGGVDVRALACQHCLPPTVHHQAGWRSRVQKAVESLLESGMVLRRSDTNLFVTLSERRAS